jgi:hypothetical protein
LSSFQWKFLLVGKKEQNTQKDGTWVTKGSFLLTWINGNAEIVKAKTISFDFNYVSLDRLQGLKEQENGNIELLFSWWASDTPRGAENKTARIELNPEGEIVGANGMPKSQYHDEYDYGKLNIMNLKKMGEDMDPKSRDYLLTLFDPTGNVLWTKKVDMPDSFYDNDSCRGFLLPDGTMLLTTLIQFKELYLTRLNQKGEVMWGTKTAGTSNTSLSGVYSTKLLANGNLMVSVYLSSKTGSAISFFVFDPKGNMIETVKLHQACSENFQIQEENNGDVWVSSSSDDYSFGESSALLFYYPGGIKTNGCNIFDIDFLFSKALIPLESMPNVPNLSIQPIDLKASTISRDQTSKAVLALTKDLCP